MLFPITILLYVDILANCYRIYTTRDACNEGQKNEIDALVMIRQ